jgi:hypothetical protein
MTACSVCGSVNIDGDCLCSSCRRSGDGSGGVATINTGGREDQVTPVATSSVTSKIKSGRNEDNERVSSEISNVTSRSTEPIPPPTRSTAKVPSSSKWSNIGQGTKHDETTTAATKPIPTSGATKTPSNSKRFINGQGARPDSSDQAAKNKQNSTSYGIPSQSDLEEELEEIRQNLKNKIESTNESELARDLLEMKEQIDSLATNFDKAKRGEAEKMKVYEQMLRESQEVDERKLIKVEPVKLREPDTRVDEYYQQCKDLELYPDLVGIKPTTFLDPLPSPDARQLGYDEKVTWKEMLQRHLDIQDRHIKPLYDRFQEQAAIHLPISVPSFEEVKDSFEMFVYAIVARVISHPRKKDEAIEILKAVTIEQDPRYRSISLLGKVRIAIVQYIFIPYRGQACLDKAISLILTYMDQRGTSDLLIEELKRAEDDRNGVDKVKRQWMEVYLTVSLFEFANNLTLRRQCHNRLSERLDFKTMVGLAVQAGKVNPNQIKELFWVAVAVEKGLRAVNLWSEKKARQELSCESVAEVIGLLTVSEVQVGWQTCINLQISLAIYDQSLYHHVHQSPNGGIDVQNFMSMLDRFVSKCMAIFRLHRPYDPHRNLLRKPFVVRYCIAYTTILRVRFLAWSIGQKFPESKLEQFHLLGLVVPYHRNIKHCNFRFVLDVWNIWFHYDILEEDAVISCLRNIVLDRPESDHLVNVPILTRKSPQKSLQEKQVKMMLNILDKSVDTILNG